MFLTVKSDASQIVETGTAPTVLGPSSSVSVRKELSPLLKEMQGSFALEGFVISDDRMREYAAEFSELKEKGVIHERIRRAMARRSARTA